MELTISIDPALENQWYAHVEQMVDLELSSLTNRLKIVDVSLVSSRDPQQRLKCEVSMLTAHGEDFVATMVNRDARHCVLDALQRCKREMLRSLILPRKAKDLENEQVSASAR